MIQLIRSYIFNVMLFSATLLYALLSFCLFFPDTTPAVPVVIRCVRTTVTESTNSLLVHLVSMVTGWQTTEEPSGASFKQNVPESVTAKIPKEWNYTPLEARGKETSKSTHTRCVTCSREVADIVGLFSKKITCMSPSSCHIRNHSGPVLHFHQPALGRRVRASPRPLPLPSGREAPLPACPAAALNGPVTLGPVRLSDPGPGGLGHTGTDQWSGSGPRRKGTPVPPG